MKDCDSLERRLLISAHVTYEASDLPVALQELIKLKVVLVYVWQHISIITAQLKEALQSSRAVLRTHSLVPMRK